MVKGGQMINNNTWLKYHKEDKCNYHMRQQNSAYDSFKLNKLFLNWYWQLFVSAHFF